MTESKEIISGYSKVDISYQAIKLLSFYFSSKSRKPNLLMIAQSVSAHPGNSLRIHDEREKVVKKAKDLELIPNELIKPNELILSQLKEVLNQPGLVSIKEGKNTVYAVIQDTQTKKPEYLFSVKNFPGRASVIGKQKAYWRFISLSRNEKKEKHDITIACLTDANHYLNIRSVIESETEVEIIIATISDQTISQKRVLLPWVLKIGRNFFILNKKQTTGVCLWSNLNPALSRNLRTISQVGARSIAQGLQKYI